MLGFHKESDSHTLRPIILITLALLMTTILIPLLFVYLCSKTPTLSLLYTTVNNENHNDDIPSLIVGGGGSSLAKQVMNSLLSLFNSIQDSPIYSILYDSVGKFV